MNYIVEVNASSSIRSCFSINSLA